MRRTRLRSGGASSCSSTGCTLRAGGAGAGCCGAVSAARKNKNRVSTGPRLPPAGLARFFVLELDAAAGSGLQGGQKQSNIVFVDAKDQGLLLTLIVGVADGEKMLAGLAQNEKRRYEDGCSKASVDILPVFQQVDALVGHAPARAAGIENKGLLVEGLGIALAPRGDLRDGAANVLHPSAGLPGGKNAHRAQQDQYSSDDDGEAAHF